ncbi:MAG: glycosyltransferase family 39 protein [Bacteroidota bacterium]|nr:glycosyltransferase family 39 protein [Bacteroidota bacterium]
MGFTADRFRLGTQTRVIRSPLEWPAAEKTGNAILVSLPFILLLAQTLPYISSVYWEDEIFSISVSRSWSSLLAVFRDYENNMSLYYVLLHLWIRIFGETEAATHSLSLLSALITLALFYGLERAWLNKRTALMGAFLLAANPTFAYYAVESRSYSFLILSAVISTRIFVRLLRKPESRVAIWYGISIVCGVYIHYFGILILLVHALSIPRRALTRPYLFRALLSGLIILAGTLPLLLFPPQNRDQIDWIIKPDFTYLLSVLKDLFGGGYVCLLLGVCLLIAARERYWKHDAGDGYFLTRLSLIWTIIPACLIFLFACLVKPAFLSRFFVWCIPGAVILTCLAIESTKLKGFWKMLVCLLLIVMLLMNSFSVLSRKGSGYPEAVQYLNDHVVQGESVLAYPYYKSVHAAFYLDKMPSPNLLATPLIITRSPFVPGGGGRDPDPDLGMLNKIVSDNNRVYLLCREKDESCRADTVQNRTWFLKIRNIIKAKHPRQQTMIFGEGSEQPIRIIIYE